ncbi:MAG: GNAT family N-acetyltransferase [Oscillospiraceae bacterium]|jgi:ribosomal protein S18 acetylase RimI-like enzyme|nr:GNAT family N-acetyltransferase [Oscillospiraceae bacterium]
MESGNTNEKNNSIYHFDLGCKLTDIMSGSALVLFCDDQFVGSSCRADNHITRVYVLPAFQGKGCGSYIMRQLEDEIAKSYNEAVLDASLPAVRLYEKLGYATVKHKKLVVENDAVLVYEVMKKELHDRNNRKEGGTSL